jgi:hypothetical protein
VYHSSVILEFLRNSWSSSCGQELFCLKKRKPASASVLRWGFSGELAFRFEISGSHTGPAQHGLGTHATHLRQRGAEFHRKMVPAWPGGSQLKGGMCVLRRLLCYIFCIMLKWLAILGVFTALAPAPDDAKAKASKAAESHDKSKRGQRNKPR